MKRNNTSEKENYLDKVPAFSEKHSWRQEKDGMVTILMENTGFFNRIFQKLLKKPKVSQIHLDEMGSFILPLVDGKRSVYDISVLVKEQFGDKAEPLYERLVKFMQVLEENGFVNLGNKKIHLQ